MDLPSSHGGGVLPGNQRGLSGSAAAHTVTDLAAVGAEDLLARSLFPDKKEAFTTDPLFWTLKMFKQRVH